MKKLLTVLFSFMIVFALAMPVFAQDAGQAAPTTSTKTKKSKAAKTKKAKTATTTAAPAQ
jgi:biopolymer transport protein ExbD